MTNKLTFQEKYDAIGKQDTQYEGVFITAVKTTEIFCRPSCRARKPKAENVLFYTQHRRQYRMVSDPVSALYYHNVNIFAFTQDCNDGKDFVEKLGGNGFSPNPWRSPIKKPVPKCRSARTSRVEKTTNR
jgi:hypothetical protein